MVMIMVHGVSIGLRLRWWLVTRREGHGGNGGGQREDSGVRGGESTQGMLGGCGVAAGGLRVEWVGCQGSEAA